MFDSTEKVVLSVPSLGKKLHFSVEYQMSINFDTIIKLIDKNFKSLFYSERKREGKKHPSVTGNSLLLTILIGIHLVYRSMHT